MRRFVVFPILLTLLFIGANASAQNADCEPADRDYGPLHIAWIDCLHPDDEVVVIVNGSAQDIDLTGYVLTSEGQGQDLTFQSTPENPVCCTIGAHDVLRVHSGERNLSDFADDRDLHWLNANGTRRETHIWNNDGDSGGLFDAEGVLVDTYHY